MQWDSSIHPWLEARGPADLVLVSMHDDDVFRRVREDGDLGEEYVFHRSDDGRVERLAVHGNYSRKVR